MSEKEPLKSSYELAMEKLRERDRQNGATEPRVLTKAQKEEIAQLRQQTRAKLAELEILHRDQLAAVAGDPEKRKELEENYQTDRRRAESALESALKKARES